jgi:hypothetical protein
MTPPKGLWALTLKCGDRHPEGTAAIHPGLSPKTVHLSMRMV